jgi:nicotinamidase-related amidase
MTTTGDANPSLTLEPARAALLIVDIQERLAAAMPDEARHRAEKNVAILAEAARRFELPVVISEQYPRGLGPTTAAVAEAVAALGPRAHRFEKVEFSACAAPAFAPVWTELGQDQGRDQWIVTGMETHVCVYQTVRELCARGAAVHVVGDAVASRTTSNWHVGLELVSRAGAVVTSTEVVVFDLLGRAGSDDFKALSRLIR